MKKLILSLLLFIPFLKADAKMNNDYYFSFNPNIILDDLTIPMIGSSFGVKGKGKFNGYDVGSEVYFLGEKAFLLYGQVQYMFYPSYRGKLKPYLGTGISFPMFGLYKDDLSMFGNNKYTFDWNRNFVFGLKSTAGISYPLKSSKGFTEIGISYPMFNGKELYLYKKESRKIPNAISMKIGFLF